jgi:capsular polysaccharide transport system permease protein
VSEKTVTDDNQLMQAERPSVNSRSQKMAAALSSYARALTFENRSRRNLYRLAGFAPRPRDRVFPVLLMIIVGITFVLPMAGSIVYYAFIASPGYTSEVRFIVRSSAPFLSRDRYSSETVEPKAKIVQDTAVLLNYLNSPAIIQDLEKSVDLRQIFGRDDIDMFSRLKADATQDDILKYWRKRCSTTVNPKSGIVELEVTAFTPKEAHDLVKLALTLSEQQINKLSSGMWSDLLASTQRDVDNATKEVSDLRGKFRDTQNQTGVFDVDLSAESLLTVLTGIESNIAELKSRRSALSQSVGDGSPQMSDIDRRLTALEEQEKSFRNRTAGSSGASAGNLADYANVFDKLKLDVKMAEGKLQSAIGELEKVKLVSSLQLVYVDNFTEPTLPGTNTYPNVPLALFLRLLLFASLCGAAFGVVLLIRKKLD